MKKITLSKKIIAVFLCILTLWSGIPLPIYAQNTTLEFRKDTTEDFNSFVAGCTLIERIQLMQSLKGLDIDLKDSYFGVLYGLPSLDNFAKKKKEVSTTRPLKPETFNDVAPETVQSAIEKGILKTEVVSRKSICEALRGKAGVSSRTWYGWRTDPDKIDYHKDVVQWLAEEKEIDKNQINTLSTYQLERKITEKYFADIWDKLTPEQREQLLTKIENDTGSSIINKAGIAAMTGAGAIGALSATVAFTGFAFYTTMSSVISAVAGLVGVTLPFAAYAGTSATIGFLTGPPGWIIAGCLFIAGGTAVLLWPDSDEDEVAAFVMTMNAIKASRLKSLNLEKGSSTQSKPYTQSNSYSGSYGQNFQYNQNMYRQPNMQNYPNNMRQFQFGMNNGNSAARNEAEALTRAATQGNVEAMLNLGNCYYYGRGVVQSYPNAIACWTEAAQRGSQEAWYILGKCYYNGIAVNQNLFEAVRYFQMGANQGHTEAQSALGVCYYYGYGVSRNTYEARRWLSMAANKGDAIARQMMSNYSF